MLYEQMTAEQRRQYGFIRLSYTDKAKIGIKPKTSREKEALLVIERTKQRRKLKRTLAR